MAGALTYVTGDATQPAGGGPKMICHVVNDEGGWGAGFVMAVSRRWPQPETAYRMFSKAPNFCLGMVQPVQVEFGLWVLNMVAQRGYWNGNPSTPAVSYDALRTCLTKVARFALKQQATVHAPRFGAGLAGGDWRVIEKIIQETLVAAGLDVTIYDFVG